MEMVNLSYVDSVLMWYLQNSVLWVLIVVSRQPFVCRSAELVNIPIWELYDKYEQGHLNTRR